MPHPLRGAIDVMRQAGEAMHPSAGTASLTLV